MVGVDHTTVWSTPNMPFRKTPIAARELGVPYYTLIGLLRSGRIPPPVKDSSGDYLWSTEDIERARQALRRPRQRKAVPV
jgi:hypothetical protein